MKLLNISQTDEIADLLNQGLICVLPTDTTYGLVCRAADSAAVQRLYKTKGRANKPGTIIAAGISQLVDLGIKYRYLKAVEGFWPGPISIAIPYNIGSLNSAAVRVPADDKLHQLLLKTGPLLTTSANSPGEPTASNIDQAKHYFSDTVDAYVDGGDLSSRQPSTVIRVVDDAIEVIREGAVKIDETGAIKR